MFIQNINLMLSAVIIYENYRFLTRTCSVTQVRRCCARVFIRRLKAARTIQNVATSIKSPP